MKQRLNIMSWCMVSIAIPNVLTVKMQILLCSSRLSVPTSTYKTQLASMWSISCNIQHLIHQRSKHKIHWSMFQQKNLSPRQAHTYGTSTRCSAPWHHRANKDKSGFETDGVRALGVLHSLRSKKTLAVGKWWETYFVSNKMKEKWIEDSVQKVTAVARKRLEDAEPANK